MALPIFPGRPRYCDRSKAEGVPLAHAVVTVRWTVTGVKKESQITLTLLCWHYLSSRAVTRQVLSAQMSLTSVFGMGTGGPSSQSIPTRLDGSSPSFILKVLRTLNAFLLYYPSTLLSSLFLGDPWENRTPVTGVRGRCLNRLTNGPLVHLHGLEPGTH